MINLWNVEWINSKKIINLFNKIKIVNQEEKDNMPQKIDREEINIFGKYEGN